MTGIENILPTGNIAQMQDEIENLHIELAVKELEIKRLKAANNMFVEIVAHDLRNPISVIMSFTELLSDEAKDVLSVIQLDFLTRIETSAKFMLALIADLLDLSQLDAGEMIFNSERIDLVSLVAENVRMKQDLAAEKNIRITFGRSDAVAIVNGDAGRLNQVLNILVSNAVKYSYSGDAVIVHITMHDEHVLIHIADNGRGIAIENLEEIFIPFKIISRKGSNNERGTGLGLAISRRIIEAHQGRLSVESELGKGSEFIVMLPVC